MQGKQLWLPALAVVLALAAAVAPGAIAASARSAASARVQALRRTFVVRIERQRDEAWRWLRLMGRPLPPYGSSAGRSQSLGYDRWVLGLWTRRALTAHRLAVHPPHRRAWLCIHGFEAAWSDPNPPYYGGLQMDYGFQETYGLDLLRRKGTADHWTPVEQMWVAERAFRSGRGFSPWPNTARSCGVL